MLCILSDDSTIDYYNNIWVFLTETQIQTFGI